MTHDAAPAERAPQRTNAGDLRLGGALWVIAGVCCAGLLLFVFVRENLLMASLGLSLLFLAGAVVALLTGALVIARPGRGVVRWSSGVGLAWLLVFGSVAAPGIVKPDPDRDPLVSLAMVIGFGVAGAVTTFWSARSFRTENAI